MAKEYFSHDINTRADDKMKALIRRHRMTGYGVFWSIVEDLYANANALRIDCEGIADDLRCESEMVRSIIYDFDLFKINEERKIFSSDTVKERLKLRKAKSVKASESANKRWNKDDANALPTQSEGNAIKERKVKEKKLKEIKENEIVEIPPLPPMGDEDSKKNIVEVFDPIAIGLKAEQKKEPLPGAEKIKPVVINLRDSNFSHEFTENAWEKWKEFRRQKRKPISGALEEKTAMKQLWAMCGGDERTAAQIINQSISNGWQGLFELKDINRSSTNQQNLSNKTKGQIAFERMNEKLDKAGIF